MKVTVRWRDETAETEGLHCGVPGLVITHPVIRANCGLHIMHERSGCVIGRFLDDDPETVLAAAQELGMLADWVVSGTELQGSHDLARKTLQVMRRWGGDVPHGRIGPRTDIGGGAG